MLEEATGRSLKRRRLRSQQKNRAETSDLRSGLFRLCGQLIGVLAGKILLRLPGIFTKMEKSVFWAPDLEIQSRF